MSPRAPTATPPLTDTLCTRCGLCCDGTLFADVALRDGDEGAALSALGLKVAPASARQGEGDAPRLHQPCRALRDTRCTVYADRPACCRAFECRVLLDVRAGRLGVPRATALVDEARARTGHVHTLLAALGERSRTRPLAARVGRALEAAHAEPDAAPVAVRAAAELEVAMAELQNLLWRRFLKPAPVTAPRSPASRRAAPPRRKEPRMPTPAATPAAVTAYIAAAPEPARTRLRTLRAVVRAEAPDAVERIAYGLPTWHQGENLVHLGASAHHVGVYPGPAAIVAFARELRAFKTSKGALQLPHDAELPTELVRRIVRWRLEQVAAKAPRPR